jgi:glycosyltransferase involved in cell wall biosynthesis
VHPSSADAFPTALLEAMAAGVPVVATAVGGIPEIVDDGETGILLAPPPAPEAFARALETLLGDPERRARMGERGRARWEERFSAERWAQRLRAVYEEALAPGRSGR